MYAAAIGFNNVCLLPEFDRNFNDCLKSEFCLLVPTKPCTIGVDIDKRWDDEEEENNLENRTLKDVLDDVRRDDEEEEEKQIIIINTDKIFKLDECVICLTNSPNILFCNGGHLCLCEESDKTKSLKVCPICKTENTIKRTI